MPDWVDGGRWRYVKDETGAITSFMKIVASPQRLRYPLDETLNPVLVEGHPNNVFIGEYISTAGCQRASDLLIV